MMVVRQARPHSGQGGAPGSAQEFLIPWIYFEFSKHVETTA